MEGYPGLLFDANSAKTEVPFTVFVHRWEEFSTACDAEWSDADRRGEYELLNRLRSTIELHLRDVLLALQ